MEIELELGMEAKGTARGSRNETHTMSTRVQQCHNTPQASQRPESQKPNVYEKIKEFVPQGSPTCSKVLITNEP